MDPSETRVSAILIKKNSEKAFNIEGSNIGDWILINFSDIIVHIFQKKTREFYNIEELWGDAEFTKHEEQKIIV